MNCTVVRLLSAVPFLVASSAQAWEFRSRFIERVGVTDVLLPNNTIDASDGRTRTIRVQFGVFDDADGPAPAGGFTGWNAGFLTVSGPEDNSNEYRTPGRIAPFNHGGPEQVIPQGLPTSPFTELQFIDARLFDQTPMWNCNPDGSVPPMPLPVARGINTFISIYSFSITPNPGAVNYTVSAQGELHAAASWTLFGTPVPPSLPPGGVWPNDCVPGHVVYTQSGVETRLFQNTLTVIVPSPAPLAILLISTTALCHRRRTVLR